MPFAVRNLPATLSDAGFHSQQGFRLMARCLRLRCRHAVDAARRRRVWDPTDALSPSLPPLPHAATTLFRVIPWKDSSPPRQGAHSSGLAG